MSGADDARRLALVLPEASEQDHHGRPSFRVGGKIFATLWDEDHMNVMLDEAGILTTVQAHPEICAEVGADFVKTSTGYGETGATDDDLRLMRRCAPPHVQVKAAGGVRSFDRLLAVRAIGVTR